MLVTKTTLSRHLSEEQRAGADAELGLVLVEIAAAAKLIATGVAASEKPAGLGAFAHDTLLRKFDRAGIVAGILAEEKDEAHEVACESDARYLLAVSPLAAATSLDAEARAATIFGVYRRAGRGCERLIDELTSKDATLAAAGYVLYGASTVLLYAAGRGVHGFTLEPAHGDFVLSRWDVRMPARGRILSADLARRSFWPVSVRTFVDDLARRDPPYATRYAGLLAADAHAVLLEGGICFHLPEGAEERVKVRLVFESGPLAHVAEKAGGRATTGTTRILDLKIQSTHERVPLVLGGADEVARYETFLHGGGPAEGGARKE